MFKLQNIKKFLIIVALITSLAVSTVSGLTVDSFSRPMSSSSYGNFILQGSPQPIAGSISGYSLNTGFYWGNNLKLALTTQSNGVFSSSWTPTYADYKPGIYSSSIAEYYGTPANFKILATYLGNSSAKEISGYVTCAARADYTSNDSTFRYYDEQNNSFFGKGTGTGVKKHNDPNTYNCLAYVVGIYSKWQWPAEWIAYGNNIPLAKMLSYMNGSNDGIGNKRTIGYYYSSGSTNWKPYITKVIYYSGGHFAKVLNYNADGSPKEIMSKWGYGELIKSTTYNPFTSSGYGSPKYYFN